LSPPEKVFVLCKCDSFIWHVFTIHQMCRGVPGVLDSVFTPQHYVPDGSRNGCCSL